MMTAQSIPLPESTPQDPEIEMGRKLMAYQRRSQLIQTLKVGLVWLVLIVVLVITLLQLDVEPGYAYIHASYVLEGIFTTIEVSLASIAIASILALLGALGRLSKNAIAQGLSGFYVSIIRGTPLLIQIYLIYLGLPQIGQQLQARGFSQLGQLLILTGVQSGILALSLNYGAYMTEIFRAGIQSIAHGQREAAESIGMSRWQIIRRIILPQAVRVIIPDIGNQFIAMQKDSALVSYMGIWEITYRANRMARQDSRFMEMFLLAALIYWILTIVSSWLEGALEHRLTHAYER